LVGKLEGGGVESPQPLAASRSEAASADMVQERMRMKDPFT